MIEIKKSACAGCGTQGCHILVHVEDGKKIVKIEGDPNGWGFTTYDACKRIKLWPNINEIMLDHPTRLNYPMKRVGNRGEGKWERITWEHAMDEISDKLKRIVGEYGPESIALAGGTVYGDQEIGQHRFQCLLGTPNAWWQGKQCGGGRFPIEIAMYGYDSFLANPVPGKTKCVLFWGAPSDWWAGEGFIANAISCRNKGAKLICVDPRPTQEASISDVWLQVRPGSDAALAMAILNVIIEQKLYDEEFVRKYTLGFDKLAEAVKEMPPKRASELTWVPEDKIVFAAELLGRNQPMCCMGDMVTLHHVGPASPALCYYFYALSTLTGLDREGGMHIRGNLEFANIAFSKHVAMWKYLCENPNRKRDTVGSDIYPIGSCKAWMVYYEAMKKVNPNGYEPQYLTMPSHGVIPDAILNGKPYPIKALISQTGGLSSFNVKRLVEALRSEKLELLVAMDIFPSPVTALADYVLPAAHSLERDCLMLAAGLWQGAMSSEKAIEPLYERHDDYDLWRDLGRRLGLEMPDKEKLLDMLLEPLGIGFREFVQKKRFHMLPPQLKQYERGLATRSGKIEYVPSVLEDLYGKGKFPPKYKEPAWSPIKNPTLAKEYDLVLTSRGRKWPWPHCGLRTIQEYRQMYPWPLCEISQEDAKDRGIGDGDWVYIETPVGRITQKAYISSGMLRKVVAADTFWIIPEKGEESLFGVLEHNFNALIPDDVEHTDGMFGVLPYRGLLCKVYKASDVHEPAPYPRA